MTYNIVLFGMHFTINPVAFTLGGWKVYWYGIVIAIGFVLALVYGMKNAPRFNLNTDRMLDVILVTTPVAILCARAYYVIFYDEQIDGIKGFFGFGNSSGFSGLAIYGGVIGAFICGAIMCYVRKVNIFDMFDVASLGFLIGQGIGRWGNFFNQEAYGTFTGSEWWGMQSNRTVSELGTGLVHPCFLYESIWCIAGFFVLNHFSKKRRFSGETVLMYCVWYGFGRAIIEGLRTDSLYIGSIRVSQAVSVFICLAAAVLLVVLRSKFRENVCEQEYVPQFSEQMGENTAIETQAEHIDDDTEETSEEIADVSGEEKNGTDN